MAKPCECGSPKRPGHPKWCSECLMLRQPLQVQADDAKAARARMEARIAEAGIDFKRPPRATWPHGRQWCHGCYRFRRPNAFGKGATQCKVCVSVKGHASMVKRTYGEETDYDSMFKRQGGLCAICRKSQRMRRLAVHHDHESGKVVALCCSRCNHDLLGAAHDSAQILLRAYALQVGGWPAVEAVLEREKSGEPAWNPARDAVPKPETSDEASERSLPKTPSSGSTKTATGTGSPYVSQRQRRLAEWLSSPLPAAPS